MLSSGNFDILTFFAMPEVPHQLFYSVILVITGNVRAHEDNFARNYKIPSIYPSFVRLPPPQPHVEYSRLIRKSEISMQKLETANNSLPKQVMLI